MTDNNYTYILQMFCYDTIIIIITNNNANDNDNNSCIILEDKLKAERASTVSQMSALKRSMEEVQYNYDTQHAEMSRLQKISTINEQNARLEIIALESRNERISSLLEAEMILRRQSDEKACKYDACEPELLQLRREVCMYIYACLHQ